MTDLRALFLLVCVTSQQQWTLNANSAITLDRASKIRLHRSNLMLRPLNRELFQKRKWENCRKETRFYECCNTFVNDAIFVPFLCDCALTFKWTCIYMFGILQHITEFFENLSIRHKMAHSKFNFITVWFEKASISFNKYLTLVGLNYKKSNKYISKVKGRIVVRKPWLCRKEGSLWRPSFIRLEVTEESCYMINAQSVSQCSNGRFGITVTWLQSWETLYQSSRVN